MVAAVMATTPGIVVSLTVLGILPVDYLQPTGLRTGCSMLPRAWPATITPLFALSGNTA